MLYLKEEKQSRFQQLQASPSLKRVVLCQCDKQQFAIIIIMLRQISRVLLFNAHTLKSYTYARPEEIDWLKHKFYSNPLYIGKLEYLSKLEREKGLRNFFENKSIDLFNEEELYYLFNSGIDYRIGPKAKREIMAKINSTYFLCVIAKEFRWVDEVEQSLIILRFNQQISELSLNEISFCLEIISEFPSEVLEIDQNSLQKKLMKYVGNEEHTYHMILITGYLLEMGIVFPEVVNAQNFEGWFKSNSNFDFRAIYYLYKLSEKLNYPMNEAQKATLKTHMKDAILKLELNYFENNYLVFLLQYYPQYVKILNILHFTPRAYLGYLLFYKQNSEIKIMQHKIPHSVIELTEVSNFRTIIEYRMNLSLDNALSIAKNLPLYFAHSLKAVNSYLAYLRDNKIDDLEVQFYVEKAVAQKLKLHQEFSIDITETFSVDEILSLFAHLVRNKQCSVDFWKKSVKMLQKMIEINKHTKIIQSTNDNYANLLSITSSKNFKEETRQTIFTELINLLNKTHNEWNMRHIVKLTRILARNRIGEDEILLLLERRILKNLQNHKQPGSVMGETFKENLVKLIISFNGLEKGSYKFWSEVNEILDVETKKGILNRTKQHSSLAHLYLSTNS